MTQCEMIMAHLEEHGSITPVEAMQEYGCMRLAARIADLKDQGARIKKTTAKGKNRNGDPVSFARYILEEKTC